MRSDYLFFWCEDLSISYALDSLYFRLVFIKFFKLFYLRNRLFFQPYDLLLFLLRLQRVFLFQIQPAQPLRLLFHITASQRWILLHGELKVTICYFYIRYIALVFFERTSPKLSPPVQLTINQNLNQIRLFVIFKLTLIEV